ncbi:MarR family winged helix-turn-helix transcriptional regulator [Microbacterium telephonicum]|uniref:MarR family transcriptional regulator n=1 Tax=Microbacterium telephonicum TaxID=1714841 RepID=A0A498C2H2_9MICO|nr:MarR family transcriptional regulator [Microbacterium telephonicum]RLK49423.1 MarR family transcriptional regulator [Microbacterium telephonicum]
MTDSDDLLRLLFAAHTLTRVAALETASETPSAQWRTLTLLQTHGPQRLGDLAHLSRVSQPGMTRLARQMAEDGLLERRADPADSRATVLSATPAGLAALRQWRVDLATALQPRFAELDDVDRTVLRRAAHILEERIGATADAAPGADETVATTAEKGAR